MAEARVLVVDDDILVMRSLVAFLKTQGHAVWGAETLAAGLAVIEKESLDIVLSDVYLGDGTGFDLLERAHELHPELDVVLMTGYGTIEDAMRAVRSGASNYVTKPLVDSEVALVVEKTVERKRLASETETLRESVQSEFGIGSVVSKDAAMERVMRLVKTVANARTTVLITGESGTGKTMIARAMHFASGRAAGPFVEVSCGALAETLLESELFGHEAGSFTGADRMRKGKFEAADGGTIFLDEIALAPPALQVKLLRVIQDGCLERVGGTETIHVDVRIVLATNVDLANEVARGRFREDLYYRINVLPIAVPPLRARRADIPLLMDHFVRKHAKEEGKDVKGFEPAAQAAMLAYSWPGNVRELENAVERGVLLAQGGVIPFSALPPEVAGASAAAVELPEGEAILPLKESLEEPERQIIRRALQYAAGNRDRAAKLLGINRSTLFYKLRKLGLIGAELSA